ncbi:MAG: ATP-binding protein, partial [Longimicrobiales bacterium]
MIMNATVRHLPPLPLIGRSTELAAVRARLDGVAAGRGSTLLITGEGGVGKTRLVAAVQDDAERSGWFVMAGRGYPVETDVPYALFADALVPRLLSIDADVRATLTRGADQELEHLFPALGGGRPGRLAPGDSPGEFKNRLLYNVSEVLKSLTKKTPLLVVLEDLQWADASSLELLHFAARQTTGHRVLFVGTYKDDGRNENAVLRATENSLVTLSIATSLRLEPLTRADTGELVRRVFSADAAVTGAFTSVLYGWTRGNAFFIEETLKSLVETGRLRFEHGHWIGWDMDQLGLPGSVREAVLERVRRLGTEATTIADLAAVIGARVRFETLAAVSGMPETRLLSAIDELLRAHLLTERLETNTIVYDFAHPIMREALYTGLGLTRTRLLHSTVAEALEEYHGESALAHAGELAYHFARAQSRSLNAKAATYLAAAGRDALDKYANREAASYLSAALDHIGKPGGGSDESSVELITDLARAKQRLGDYDAAVELWERALADARRTDDARRIASLERRIGLACFWSGRPSEALRRFDAGLDAVVRADDAALHVRLLLARGICLQEMGRPVEAKESVERALPIAETGGPALLARVHRALMLLYVWTGPSDTARKHGQQAIALASEVEDPTLAYSALWAMSMLSGISGDATGIADGIQRSREIAEKLRSPVLELWTLELELEFAAHMGHWDTAVGLGERGIELARALNQRTLLPRLLVWTGLLYLARDEMDRGKACVDEAWSLSGAGNVDEYPLNIHTVVPAHIGMASYHLAKGEYAEAIRVGEAGLAVADRSGSVVWSIYRLLPTVAEACF